MKKKLIKYLALEPIIIILAVLSFFVYYYWPPVGDDEFKISTSHNLKAAITEEQKQPEAVFPDAIESQGPLSNPPEAIKAVYLTSWSAGTRKRINYVIDLVENTEINAVVIDIKDSSGYIGYDTSVLEAELYNSEWPRITEIDSLIQELHSHEIYVIGRIAIFQDPVLASSTPDIAIKSKNTGGIWLDQRGLAWVDPASEKVWQYNINIAKDAVERGFDEINFDYIRFPTDGDLEDMVYPIWDGVTLMREIMKSFYGEVRKNLPDAKLSIDLFGFTATKFEDFGIGQILEDTFEYFDYISFMLYPSHFPPGFLGHENPADHPYEIVKFSMDKAIERLDYYNETGNKEAPVFRPWIQDFNLGAVYDASMVRAQIQAIEDASGEQFKGFMLWNASNVYTKNALLK